MTALSTRHGRWLVLLLGAALLPFVLEEVRPRRHDDCRNPDLLTLTLAIPGSKPAPSASRHVPAGPVNRGRSEDVVQWMQGEIENPQDPRNALRFWIVRSFDPAATSPRAVLQGSFDPDSHEVREVTTTMGNVPVHVAIDGTRRPSRVIAWAWAYDGRPAAAIFPALLKSAPSRLMKGSVPVTLFLVDGTALDPDGGPVAAAATTWIANAWSHMARHCR